MREFVITVNSTVDLPLSWLEERNVPVIPLKYTIDGETYTDMYGLSAKEFFAKLREGKMATTSQINPAEAKAALEPFLKEGKEMYKAKEAYQSIDKTDENADTLKDLLDKNPETWEFVKNYSKMKDASPADTIGEVAAGEIPLLLQWDERWGYSVYGDNMIAVNGCGPTAVAMVVSGLLCDPSVTPYKVAKFAEEQGYYAGESGTSWTLMSEGVQSFGIWGEELGLSRSEVFSALESGCPIICSMRPGDFTTTGHFIVLTKVENGKIKVNDPNSRIRSGQLWDYERLEPQIQNLWAFSRM